MRLAARQRRWGPCSPQRWPKHDANGSTQSSHHFTPSPSPSSFHLSPPFCVILYTHFQPYQQPAISAGQGPRAPPSHGKSIVAIQPPQPFAPSLPSSALYPSTHYYSQLYWLPPIRARRGHSPRIIIQQIIAFDDWWFFFKILYWLCLSTTSCIPRTEKRFNYIILDLISICASNTYHQLAVPTTTKSLELPLRWYRVLRLTFRVFLPFQCWRSCARGERRQIKVVGDPLVSYFRILINLAFVWHFKEAYASTNLGGEVLGENILSS